MHVISFGLPLTIGVAAPVGIANHIIRGLNLRIRFCCIFCW